MRCDVKGPDEGRAIDALQIRVSAAMRQWLRTEAARDGRTVTALIRDGLQRLAQEQGRPVPPPR
jgi:hypothetical protein